MFVDFYLGRKRLAMTVTNLVSRVQFLWQKLLQYRSVRVAVRTYETFNEIEADQRAASFAYYALFSLVPLIALLITVGSLVFDPVVVHRVIEDYVPVGSGQRDVLWDMVSDLERARGSVSIISIALLSWTSLRFFHALVSAVNRAWHTVEIPWWQMPLKNLLMLGVLVGGLALGILLPAILQSIVKVLTVFDEVFYAQFQGFRFISWIPLLEISRYLAGGAILFYTFTLLYMLAPRKRVPFLQAWLPALLVTFLLQAVQIAFVNYLPLVVNYNAVYGTVGGLMLLLLWIYSSGLVIMGGGCFCAARQRVRADESRELAATTPSNSGN